MKADYPEIATRFGRWRVVGEPIRLKRKATRIPCKCDCGIERSVHWSVLRVGDSLSCGCWRKETTAADHWKHGGRYTRLYAIWKGMRNRCHNPRVHSYANYGGRGITVTAEWDSFVPFRDWALANGYDKELQIDRIEVNGPYAPNNARWVTAKVNSRNRRASRMVTAFGETKALAEWSDDSRCAVSYDTLKFRVRKGWNPDVAITSPVGSLAALLPPEGVKG